ESMNMTMRKVIKNKRMFPTENSVFKILYLASLSITKKWTIPIKDWGEAISHFSIKFEDRITKYM
ncbi:MAG: putative transposase, partial [Francisella sp.]